MMSPNHLELGSQRKKSGSRSGMAGRAWGSDLGKTDL